MKKREAMTVGEIIERAIAATGNSDEYGRQQACFLWADVVGPEINRQTVRRFMDKDVLHVFITSAALKHELSFQKVRIVEALNKTLGKNVVSELVIH